MSTFDVLHNRTSKRMRIYAHLDRINQSFNTKNKYIPPITIEIFPTNICNSSCKFCIYKHENIEFLDNRTFELLVESCIKMRVKAIVISGGGEPTLHEYLPTAINKLVNGGLQVGLITNGIHISNELVKAMLKCSWIRVSLLAGNANQYYSYMNNPNINQYEKVLSNIHQLASNKNKLILGTNMMLNNEYGGYDSIIEYIDLASKLKVDQVFFTEMVDSFGKFKINKTNYTNILDLIDNYSNEKKIITNISKFVQSGKQPYTVKSSYEKCSIVERNLLGLVASDGRVFSCLGQYNSSSCDKSLGNIHYQSLSSIYSPANLRNKQKPIYKDKCFFCKNATTREELDLYFCSKMIREVHDPHCFFI